MSNPTPHYPGYPGTQSPFANPFPGASTPGAPSAAGVSTPAGGLWGQRGAEATSDSYPGVVSALFDFGFHHFAALGLIRFVYVVGMIAIGVGALIAVFFGLALGGPVGIGLALGAIVIAPLALLFLRVSLEYSYSLMRMSEDIHRMR